MRIDGSANPTMPKDPAQYHKLMDDLTDFQASEECPHPHSTCSPHTIYGFTRTFVRSPRMVLVHTHVCHASTAAAAGWAGAPTHAKPTPSRRAPHSASQRVEVVEARQSVGEAIQLGRAASRSNDGGGGEGGGAHARGEEVSVGAREARQCGARLVRTGGPGVGGRWERRGGARRGDDGEERRE